MNVEVELTRDVTAPGTARALLHEQLGSTLVSDELHTAELLVSELVTNAVVHGRGTISVTFQLDDGRLRVEVADEGTNLIPAIRRSDFEPAQVGGRGLSIVDAESSRWGVDKSTTRVWFELERGPRIAEAIDHRDGGVRAPIVSVAAFAVVG